MSNDLSGTGLEQLERLAAALREARFPPPPVLSGRGIVICAGGARIFTNAYVLIRVLRDALASTLPIEVWHFGRQEISPAMTSLLDGLGVMLVDALPLVKAGGFDIRDGWQLKSFALLHSRFREVLLLDADQVPIIDPAALFDWPQYREAGAVFWPDIVRLRTDNPLWQAFGLAPAAGASFESGQILVDKARHWRPLFAALRLNERADLLYQLIYGDKDSFLLAWMLADAPYRLVPHQPLVDERYLVQRDFSGQPLFQHRTNAKWSYAGEQLELSGFVHQATCLAYLAELRDLWGGRVFNAPDRSLAARQIESDLAARAFFTMEIGDGGTIELELRPYGEFGAGRAYDRQNWWVEEREGNFFLIIRDGDSATHELRRADETYWLGRRLLAPIHQLVLKPRAGAAQASAARIPPPALADELLAAAGLADPVFNSPAAGEALRLLSRVVPGIESGLRQRAHLAEDPLIISRLLALAEALAATDLVALRKPGSNALATGYVRNKGARQ